MKKIFVFFIMFLCFQNAHSKEWIINEADISPAMEICKKEKLKFWGVGFDTDFPEFIITTCVDKNNNGLQFILSPVIENGRRNFYPLNKTKKKKEINII